MGGGKWSCCSSMKTAASLYVVVSCSFQCIKILLVFQNRNRWYGNLMMGCVNITGTCNLIFLCGDRGNSNFLKKTRE